MAFQVIQIYIYIYSYVNKSIYVYMYIYQCINAISPYTQIQNKCYYIQATVCRGTNTLASINLISCTGQPRPLISGIKLLRSFSNYFWLKRLIPFFMYSLFSVNCGWAKCLVILILYYAKVINAGIIVSLYSYKSKGGGV